MAGEAVYVDVIPSTGPTEVEGIDILERTIAEHFVGSPFTHPKLISIIKDCLHGANGCGAFTQGVIMNEVTIQQSHWIPPV